MAHDCSTLFQDARPRVVATISSREGWRIAKTLLAGTVDFLEIRADLLLENAADLPGEIAELPFPAILTVRSPTEGGKGSIDPLARAAIYQRYLSQVAAIDVELASMNQMKKLLETAREQGAACIFSHHDFADTPPGEILQTLSREAHQLGADLFKIATLTDTAHQLGILSEWLESEKSLPVAAMGMGRLGKVSRPLLAQLGSRLNYGYLDAPVVPGQWPAVTLREFLDTLPQAA